MSDGMDAPGRGVVAGASGLTMAFGSHRALDELDVSIGPGVTGLVGANAVLLVFCVELATLAITDKDLDRPSVIGGGSIYPFVQNVLLGCRNEGLGTALTTLLAAEEPEVAEMLGIPAGFAVAALVPVGWPVPERQYTRLNRNPVEHFAFADRWDNPLST